MPIIVTMKVLLPSTLAKGFKLWNCHHTSYIHVTYACMYDVWWQIGSGTLCFIVTILCYSYNFTNYAQLLSPLCPMCTQCLWDSSDRVRALSRSSNDTVDSEDVDFVSLGILTKLWYELLQESDVIIIVLVASTYRKQYTTVTLHVGIVGSIPILGSKVKYCALHFPIMLEIVLMLITAYCALNNAGIMCACLMTDPQFKALMPLALIVPFIHWNSKWYHLQLKSKLNQQIIYALTSNFQCDWFRRIIKLICIGWSKCNALESRSTPTWICIIHPKSSKFIFWCLYKFVASRHLVKHGRVQLRCCAIWGLDPPQLTT